MKIALVAVSGCDELCLASFLHKNALPKESAVLWRLENSTSTPAMLAALEDAWAAEPVEALVFPASLTGDELATRLGWRLNGGAICQILSWDAPAKTVTKAVYGNALIATLHCESTPLCFSLSPYLPRTAAEFPADLRQKHIVPVPVAEMLPPPEILHKAQPPLSSARRVLATGIGARAEIFEQFAQKLNAESGFTRQRVMAGGCDEQRMIGISGQSVAPDVCIIAGASGAPAFMAGVQQSRFIVAVNSDPAAPVFAAADVGIVGDAEAVLTELAECFNGH